MDISNKNAKVICVVTVEVYLTSASVKPAHVNTVRCTGFRRWDSHRAGI